MHNAVRDGKVHARLIQFKGLTWRGKLGLPVAVLLLGIARVAILCLPFRRYCQVFGGQDGDLEPPQTSPQQVVRACEIGKIVRGAAKVTPWASVCLPQAMVALVFLRWARIPAITHFGVALDKAPTAHDPISAHAWVVVADHILTGADVASHFTTVRKFRFNPKVH